MTWFSSATILVILAGLTVATTVDARQRHKWWESGDVKTELNIADEQSEAIEAIYQNAQPKLRALMEALAPEETALSKLVDATDTEEWEIRQQIDRVEAARGALSKERFLMIYRMGREISREQRTGLREWLRKNRRQLRRSQPGR